MIKIKFKYKDAYTRGDWNIQECIIPSIEECKRIYGLDEDCEYEIIDIEEIK